MNLRKSAREVVCRGTLCDLTTVKSLCLQTQLRTGKNCSVRKPTMLEYSCYGTPFC
jgi:hypothetical protein